MKAPGLCASAPAEVSRLIMSELSTIYPAPHKHTDILAQPCVLPSVWLLAGVPLCGPHFSSTQTCSIAPLMGFTAAEMGGEPTISNMVAQLFPTGTAAPWAQLGRWHLGDCHSLSVLPKAFSKGLESSPCPGVPLGGTLHGCQKSSQAPKAVAQRGLPVHEMQWAEVLTHSTDKLWDLLNEHAWRTQGG